MNDYYEEIAAHAHGAPQEEVCGLLLLDDSGSLVVRRCANVAEETSKKFAIADKDYLAAWKTNRLVAYYHSHWDTDEKFSEEDRLRADAARLPVFCYSLATRKFNLYRPTACIRPFTGRAFILGFQDCASIVTDYYQKNFNVEVPYFARPEHMLSQGFPQLGQFLQAAGFELVQNSPLKEGDVLAFSIRSENAVANHVAIVDINGFMIHQFSRTLSTLSPIDTWRSSFCFAMRYKGAR